MKKIFNFLVLSIFFMSCVDTKETEKENLSGNGVKEQKTIYSNPVIDRNFPDPTIIKAPDGYYYGYATNSSVDGEDVHIQVHRSKNLVDWEPLGDALPEKPDWGQMDFWAPHVFYDKQLQTYFLYYSGESTAGEFGKCLGVATSKSPEGPFVDKGDPILCGDGFVNIDPMAFDDPKSGKKLLYWGSGFGPIKVQELSEDRLSFKEGTAPIGLIFPVQNEDPENYQRLVEGAWVTRHEDYYYLYFSGDNCCGEEAHYAAMVARSDKATGPFETMKEVGRKSNVVLKMKGRWIAPGHNSVIKDDAGDDWMVYHAIDSTDPGKGRVMLIDKITYKDGWPNIQGGYPSNEARPAPVVE